MPVLEASEMKFLISDKGEVLSMYSVAMPLIFSHWQ